MKFIILLLFITSRFVSYTQQLVLPGDYPDPSVVKIGDTYWASATTSNWLPAYPLLKSKDLVHWEQQGFVFNQMPQWADYYFWAPEITYENNKVYIYYTAHKKGGNLCIAVASADRPEGPYTDHGPLMCEPVGSIDAFPMRDEKGVLYMIWKEDGNSVGKPTPIWAMQMNEERTALIGEKKELFRNELPWEKNLVEGVSMIRHGDYYYAFYAAAGCCGRECNYANGIARAKNLLGPWEKYNEPVVTDNEQWKCPGHGTPVEKDGRYYFMYHAYDKHSNVYTGRQGLLKEFRFTADGWVKFIDDTIRSNNRIATSIRDDFNSDTLSNQWQWSVFQKLRTQVNNGALQVAALPDVTGAFIGQKTLSANYTTTALVNPKVTTASAGIAAIGDEKNIVRALYRNGLITVSIVKEGRDSTLLTQPVKSGKNLYLKMQVTNGKDIVFLYGKDPEKFIVLNRIPIDGHFLPPWDRAVRAGLVAKGNNDEVAVYDYFEMIHQ